jgi:hypothetical protein
MNESPPKLADTQTSYKPIRIFAQVAAIVFSAIATWLLIGTIGNGLLNVFASSPFIAVAAICWWFVLRGKYKKSRIRMMYAFIGALIVGGIGFVAGFFGPIIFSPQVNDGPLLGIFITGPIGFMAGAIIGAIVGFIRTRKISD